MEKLNLAPRASGGGLVSPIENGWRMEIPAGDATSYRFAQLDDYAPLPRGRFASHPPLTLSLLARASADSSGTWGFGLWNDPFGLSLGFGGNPFRLPALPNALWFFHASKENYLSFRDSPRSGRVGDRDSGQPWKDSFAVSRPPVGNGFLAQSFRSPKIPSALLALTGIFSSPLLATRWTRVLLRRLASRFIAEGGIRLSLDSTQWHRYRLTWSPRRVSFEVDHALLFESLASPRAPLGIVIWIDNQFAAFTPAGKIGFGVLENPEPAWLEITELEITSAASNA